MKNKFLEIYGWYGTIAIIVGYFLVSFEFLLPANFWYQFLNVSGALGIVFISFYKKTYQPVVLNLVWFVIGIIAIFNIFV